MRRLSKAEPGSSVLIAAAIELPPEITKVYLKKTTPAAIAAFKRAVAAQAAGRSVVIVGASAGKDLNDTLLGKVG